MALPEFMIHVGVCTGILYPDDYFSPIGPGCCQRILKDHAGWCKKVIAPIRIYQSTGMP